jgi:hypothetical protein
MHSLSVLTLIFLSGCGGRDSSAEPVQGPGLGVKKVSATVGDRRNSQVDVDDPIAETPKRIVYLDQGWTPKDSQQFYFTSQGSQILRQGLDSPPEWSLWRRLVYEGRPRLVLH